MTPASPMTFSAWQASTLWLHWQAQLVHHGDQHIHVYLLTDFSVFMIWQEREMTETCQQR